MDQRQLDFAHVYRENVWRVYGFIAYRVRDRELVQDLTQATFERALRAWSRFDPRRGSESTWLMAIARNLVIDHHRRDRSAPEQAIDEHALPAVPGPEERLTTSPELLEALAQLGDREREVLALRFGGDLSASEIAALLGLSLANVQQIQSRSLRTLRTLLDSSEVALQSSRGAERTQREED